MSQIPGPRRLRLYERKWVVEGITVVPPLLAALVYAVEERLRTTPDEHVRHLASVPCFVPRTAACVASAIGLEVVASTGS